jgi:protein subunit release factor A
MFPSLELKLKRFEELEQQQLEDMATAGDSITRGSLIMEIRAGTGGDEAALFARDLFEMYTRYADRQGWKHEVLDFSSSELGGMKEVTLSITGDSAYHQLQFESGGHRVQRVPETETQGRVHTSAATVAVMPEATDVEVDIRDEDMQIDTMRAGGPGRTESQQDRIGRADYAPCRPVSWSSARTKRASTRTKPRRCACCGRDCWNTNRKSPARGPNSAAR